MGGFDDHVAIIGDWVPPSPSPRAFFSALLGDEVIPRPISESHNENRNGSLFPGTQEQIISQRSEEKEWAINQSAKSNLFNEQKMNSRGGLLERMAARAGFNAPRLNTENIRSTDVSLNPDTHSPYLTIPPGLSPTTLLESPVFLSNSLVQPSPTTGKLPFALNGNNRNSLSATDTLNKSKDSFFGDISNSSFAFKPPASVAELDPSFFLSAASKQNLPCIEVSVQPESSLQSRSVELPKNGTPMHHQDFSRLFGEKDSSFNTTVSDPMVADAVGASAEHSSPLDGIQDEEADQKGGGDAMVSGAPSDDGYNWRKYGQKQVKGSEYPRSYYKCTHQNCPVKKKVERSHEGHITEIIYKGAHNHPKPPPNRRLAIGSMNMLADLQMDGPDQVGARVGADGEPMWRQENPDTTSSAMADADLGNVPNLVHGQGGAQFESGDTLDVSSTFSNDEDEDDQVTHGSVSIGYDEGDESESKRRKIEAYATEMSGATRAIREPRVVVQTTSEVDILDDGYRWRKYGQKVVKGNPNPRSYYKCTSAGCTVRKHVERASHDLKSVITTYEGKHNHDVPAARNSSHANSSTPNNGPVFTAAQSAAAAAAAASVPPLLHRPEPSQVHNSLARFGLPGRPPLGPPHGFGFGMGQTGLASLGMAGLGPNGGKLSILPVHPYLGQQRMENEMGFLMPKGEPKAEPLSDSPSMNVPSASSVYQQIMSRLPLGPQM